MTPDVSRRMLLAWLSALTTLGLADWLLDRRHDGSTLSECTRYAFRIHTPGGRVAWTIAWMPTSLVIWRHILKRHA